MGEGGEVGSNDRARRMEVDKGSSCFSPGHRAVGAEEGFIVKLWKGKACLYQQWCGRGGPERTEDPVSGGTPHCTCGAEADLTGRGD